MSSKKYTPMQLLSQVEQIPPNIAEQLCREITSDLPEWFGLPECNEYYATGVQNRINLAANVKNTWVSLV